MKEVGMQLPVDVGVLEKAAGPKATVGYLLGLLVGAGIGVAIVLLLFAPPML
jgi:hypothetical protein